MDSATSRGGVIAQQKIFSKMPKVSVVTVTVICLKLQPFLMFIIEQKYFFTDLKALIVGSGDGRHLLKTLAESNTERNIEFFALVREAIFLKAFFKG